MRRFQGVLPFKLVVADEDLSHVTAHAGVPLVVEAMRAVISTRLYRRLRKALRYKKWRVVQRHMETLVVLLVAGGDHVSDIEVLRGDKGLERLLGFELSSPTQLKELLYRFHQADDGEPLTPGDDARLSVQGVATIRQEGPGLRLLAMVNAEVVRQVQRYRQCRRATVDVKVRSLPAEMGTLRPKALRFRLFNLVGVLVGHSRRLVVRISGAHPYAEIVGHARQAVLAMKREARAGPLPAA